MGNQYSETADEAARRIRQSSIAPCAEMISLLGGKSQDLCRLVLIDAIEEATGFDIAAGQAGRIADAVLGQLRRGRSEASASLA